MKYLSNSWQNKKQGIGWPCSLYNVIDHSHTLQSCRGCGWNTLCSQRQAPRKRCLHFPPADCCFRSPTPDLRVHTHRHKHVRRRTHRPSVRYPQRFRQSHLICSKAEISVKAPPIMPIVIPGEVAYEMNLLSNLPFI